MGISLCLQHLPSYPFSEPWLQGSLQRSPLPRASLTFPRLWWGLLHTSLTNFVSSAYTTFWHACLPYYKSPWKSRNCVHAISTSPEYGILFRKAGGIVLRVLQLGKMGSWLYTRQEHCTGKQWSFQLSPVILNKSFDLWGSQFPHLSSQNNTAFFWGSAILLYNLWNYFFKSSEALCPSSAEE